MGALNLKCHLQPTTKSPKACKQLLIHNTRIISNVFGVYQSVSPIVLQDSLSGFQSLSIRVSYRLLDSLKHLHNYPLKQLFTKLAQLSTKTLTHFNNQTVCIQILTKEHNHLIRVISSYNLTKLSNL